MGLGRGMAWECRRVKGHMKVQAPVTAGSRHCPLWGLGHGVRRCSVSLHTVV